MTTYSDIKTRLFYDRDKVVKQRLRRKRSSGRLKQYNSEQDLRSWGTNQDERRRHILELMSGLKTLWGNYVPFEVLFAQLALISSGKYEEPVLGSDELASKEPVLLSKDSSDKLSLPGPTQPGPMQIRGRAGPGTAAIRKRELQTQKEDLSGLVKALTKDANNLRRDSVSAKAENETLRGSVNVLEDQLKKLQDQLEESQKANGDKDKLQDALKKEAENARGLQNDLETERRLSQELENARNEAEAKAYDLAQQLEEERRKSALIEDQLQDALERERRKSGLAKDAADRFKNELEEERRQSQGTPAVPEDELRASIELNEKLQKELEDERRRSDAARASIELNDKLQRELEDERRRSDAARASIELNDKLQRELEDERRRSDAARDSLRKLEKQLEEEAKQDADDALEEKSNMRRAMKMEQCLRNELSSLENENDCLRKEIERLRMVECELAECELKNQDLLCEVESYKCCLDRQQYDNQKMSCLIKEQQDLIFNLQDVVTSNKSNENLQSESWASCNESLVEYKFKIEDLNSTVAQQKSLIASQGQCLQRQHSYISQLEQVRCKLQAQVEGYKNEILEAKTEVDSLCKKRKQLQQELDFLTNKLERYLEKIQGLEKSQILNSKLSGKTTQLRVDRGSNSGYSTSYSRDIYGESSSSKYSSSMQPEQDNVNGRSTGNRQPSCRSRSCQPGPKNQYGFC